MALAIALLIGLGACAGNPGGGAATTATAAATQAAETTAQSTTAAATTTTTASTTTAPQYDRDMTWFREETLSLWSMDELERYIPAYDPPITLTSVHYMAAGGSSYPEGDSMDNNKFTRRYERLMGIKVKYDWYTDWGSAYNTKLNMSIAADDLPDFYIVQQYKAYYDLATAGKLMDLQPYFDEWASPTVREITEAFPEGFESAYIDGHLYSMPVLGWGIITHPDILWLRDDWRKEADLEPPETIDDMLDMARIFMDYHPGTYGISLHSELGGGMSSFRGIANGFHAYPGHWYKDDSGDIVYGSVQPAMRNCLQAMQGWYNEGILSQEFAVRDYNQDVVSAKVGLSFGAQWAGYYPLADAMRENPDAEWLPYPIPSADGKPVTPQCWWDVGQYFVVNSKCKNPDALIKMINLFCWEGKENEEGKVVGLYKDEKDDFEIEWQDDPVFYTDPARDYLNFKIMNEAIGKRDPSVAEANPKYRWVYENSLKWLDDRNADFFGTCCQYMPGGSYDVIATNYIEPGRYLLTDMKGSPPDIWTEKAAVLDKMQNETFIKIIMGAPISEFDTFVEDWYSLGGAEALNAVNVMYNRK